MLKKLRRRFVAISMSIICSVLVVFYLFASSVFFVSMTRDMKSVLKTYSAASDFDVIPQIGESDADDSMFALHSGNVCVVDVKEMGKFSILDFSRANMDESSASLSPI